MKVEILDKENNKAGTLELPEGCIVAKRHVHMTLADAAFYGVTNGEMISVWELEGRAQDHSCLVEKLLADKEIKEFKY